MVRKHDPLDDFEVVPHNSTPEEDQIMREFIRKYKEEHSKKGSKKIQVRKSKLASAHQAKLQKGI